MGEIYFLGPTNNGEGLYYSTDFGETATFVDGSMNFISIAADKTQGGVYCVTLPEAFYYSDGFGYTGTWEVKSSDIGNVLHSGIIEGHIYYAAFKHSEDYGLNFINHQLNNYSGIFKESEIGYNNKGYLLTYQIDGTDTLYFSISYDSFENIEVIYKFNMWAYGLCDLSYGSIDGELFIYNEVNKSLYFTNTNGYNWAKKNSFTCPNLPILGITGGRQDGELYMLIEYLQMMGQRKHVYVYHSLDNGETFTVYHPVSIGPDPIYANFIAEDTLVEPGDTVQFTDLSNDAETWEWDFDNDGTIDSDEQNPMYIYQDTGYYTVKLSITGEAVQDYGIRHDYIHVDNITNVENSVTNENYIKVYPVPSNNYITIESKNILTGILIYNSKGVLVKALGHLNHSDQKKVFSLSTSDFDNGVYFIKFITTKDSQIQKIIITH